MCYTCQITPTLSQTCATFFMGLIFCLIYFKFMPKLNSTYDTTAVP